MLRHAIKYIANSPQNVQNDHRHKRKMAIQDHSRSSVWGQWKDLIMKYNNARLNCKAFEDLDTESTFGLRGTKILS